MKRLQLICLVLVVSISFPPSSIVQADMAPPPAPGVGGLEPFKYQDTNVQMVFERVEMEVANIPQKDFNDLSQGDDKVNVNAWFMLHNLGKVEETMQVVFPLGNFNDCTSFQKQSQPPSYMSLIVMPETFTAAVNGVPVTISDVTTDHPHKDEGCTTMEWAAFNVTFPVNQDVLVRISYSLMNESVDAIENLEYVLETGSAWKGPITKGYVVLRFPYPVEDNILKGSTPGYTKLYNEIYWSFDNLEPTRITLKSRSLSHGPGSKSATIASGFRKIQMTQTPGRCWLRTMASLLITMATFYAVLILHKKKRIHWSRDWAPTPTVPL